MMRWFVNSSGRTIGPLEEEAILRMGTDGQLIAGMHVRDEATGAWSPIEQSPFARYVAAEPTAQSLPKKPSIFTNPVVLVFCGIGALGVVGMLLINWHFSRKAKATAELALAGGAGPAAARVVAPPKPKEPTLAERLQAEATVSGAVDLLKHGMRDTQDEMSPGAAALAVWATQRLTWADLQSVPETERALVMKDPEAERGKRLCMRGSITEIQVDRSSGEPIYTGGLITPAYNVLRFAAVGSTGKLVENSAARFCGIVTGRYSYSNAGGGTTHAVYTVGMFDLPENKQAQVTQ